MADQTNAPAAPERKPSGMTVSVEGSNGPQSDTFDARTGDVTTLGQPSEAPADNVAVAPEGDTPAPVGDLGDFDGADQESVAKFDAAYFNEGKLNTGKLSEEFDASGGKGLNEATYKFLDERLGISKEYAKEIESALVAKRQGNTETVLAAYGGQTGYDARLAWATGDNGYTPAQREAFNAALKRGGDDATTALDALDARYLRANPQAAAAARAKPAVPAGAPRRDVTAGASAAPAGGAVGGGFKDQAEADAAFREATSHKARGERDVALREYEAKKAKTGFMQRRK